MATESKDNDDGDLVGSRVRVDLADGFNFVGTVRRDYLECGGQRLLVEDTQGNERVVRPARPSVSISELDADQRRDRRGGRW